MNKIIYFTAALIIGGMLGCDRNNQASTPATVPSAGQQAADKVQNVTNQTEAALHNAAQATTEAAANATTRASDLAQQAGSKLSPSPDNSTAPDASSIRSSLATVVNDALTKSDVSGLIKDFSKSSQTQFNQVNNQSFDDLNPVISQIQSDWMSKYHHSFDASASALQGDDLVIRQGAYASDHSAGAVQSGSGTATADRNTAVVRFTLPGNQTVRVPMAKEGMLSGWKMDIPNVVDAQKLHDNLKEQLTAIENSKANWPNDENQAYRLVTARIVAAIENMNIGS